MLGPNDWQLPIPLVQKAGAWQFDTAADVAKCCARRIGRNELSAIQTALAYVDAQNEYASMNPQGTQGRQLRAAHHLDARQEGRPCIGRPAANEPQSPLGEAFALATIQGYRPGAEAAPYHGYYYKVLTGAGRRTCRAAR